MNKILLFTLLLFNTILYSQNKQYYIPESDKSLISIDIDTTKFELSYSDKFVNISPINDNNDDRLVCML
jgi:hypothetical protein